MPFELLNESTLEELAGERAFDRGVDYFEEGRVAGLKEQDGVDDMVSKAMARMRSEGVVRSVVTQ